MCFVNRYLFLSGENSQKKKILIQCVYVNWILNIFNHVESYISMTILHCYVHWIHIEVICIFQYVDNICVFIIILRCCISFNLLTYYVFLSILNYLCFLNINWRFWFIIYHILVRKLCIHMCDFCFRLRWALKLAHNKVISFCKFIFVIILIGKEYQKSELLIMFKSLSPRE